MNPPARSSSRPPMVDLAEVEITAVRAQGAGGQNVNKVSSAVHLRFDILKSSLPPEHKARLLALRDRRITEAGVIVMKSQQYRTQEQNRTDALRRLDTLVRSVAAPPRRRVPTQPTRASRERRLEAKRQQSERKVARGTADGFG